MQINTQTLQAAFTGFKVVFQKAFEAAPVHYLEVATEVPSTTKQEVYPWLGQNTKFREWLGDRAIQNLNAHSFTIKNKHFENTVAIDRDDFEDKFTSPSSPLLSTLSRPLRRRRQTVATSCRPRRLCRLRSARRN